jgi:hypothetical protein
VRWALLLLLVGCRQIFGIDEPSRAIPADAVVIDDAGFDAAGDPTLDAAPGCSMPPPAPADSIDEAENAGATTLRIKNFKVASTGTKYIVAAAGDSFMVTFDYTWKDTSCESGCIDQIEIGYIPGDRVGCPFDGQVPNGLSGSSMFTLTAPALQGWTSIRIAIGQNFSCTYEGAQTWYEGTPPPPADIAGYVCVQ